MNVLDTFRLDGKTALVTGGTGKYGQQIVRALAQAGAHTAMARRNLDKLEKQAQTFRDEGLDVTAYQLDQSDETQVLGLRDQLPFSFDQTIEQMKIIIAGIRSREQGGKRVALSDVKIGR